MFNWYKLFSLTEFLESDLTSRKLTVLLSEVGQKDILITRGNLIGITYEDVFLPIEFNGLNPYSRDGYAVYRDKSNDVWLGIEVP